jgi:hypothetical protein
MTAKPGLRAACACGSVVLQTQGRPITAAICHCDDCQAAATRFAALPGSTPVMDEAAGTAMVMVRKDRMVCVQGADRLQPLKLKPGSPTSRYVATCCNSAMYLGFDDAKPWVDLYLGRIEGEAPPIKARICTRFLPEGMTLPDDVPSSPGYPFGFLIGLVGMSLARMVGR